jgi:phage terminase small subunit
MILENARHEKFAQAVARGRMQGQAYREAGFAARGGSARTGAVNLGKRPEVKARIAELRGEATAAHRLNRRELLNYLVDVIETPAGEVREGDRLCYSYRHTARQRSTRMPDKLKAAEMLAKLCGWLAPEQLEHSGPVEVIVRIADPEPDSTKFGPEPQRIVDAKNAMLRNVRHEKFAMGVAGGTNHSRAYEEAGFDGRPGMGLTGASRLLKMPEVRGRIAELQREAAAECRMDRSQLLDFLVEVMMTPAGDVTEESRLCQAFHFTKDTRWLKMPDKLRAAELVIRIHGWEEPEKEYSGEPIVVRIGGEV